MQDTATNRQIVQEGLDRRAALRLEREKEMDRQTEEMIHTINQRVVQLNNAAQESEEKAVARRASRRREAARIRRERSAESAICFNWFSFLLRVFTPMLIGAATLGLANRGLLPYALATPCTIIACLLSVEAFVSRFIPRQQKSTIRKGEM